MVVHAVVLSQGLNEVLLLVMLEHVSEHQRRFQKLHKFRPWSAEHGSGYRPTCARL